MARHVRTANILTGAMFPYDAKKHDLTGKRIIIIGAGIAGVAFITVIERS